MYSNVAYITDFVSAENMRGIMQGHRKLAGIRQAVSDGWLRQVALSEKEKTFFESLSISLGFGESSSIAVAKLRGLTFACDDRVARREADLLGVKLTGTIGILIKSIEMGIVNRKEADKILHKMVGYGFYTPISSIKDV